MTRVVIPGPASVGLDLGLRLVDSLLQEVHFPGLRVGTCKNNLLPRTME